MRAILYIYALMNQLDQLCNNFPVRILKKNSIRKVRWLQSEDDEPAVKISSVIAVLSLTMQPYSNILKHTNIVCQIDYGHSFLLRYLF